MSREIYIYILDKWRGKLVGRKIIFDTIFLRAGQAAFSETTFIASSNSLSLLLNSFLLSSLGISVKMKVLSSQTPESVFFFQKRKIHFKMKKGCFLDNRKTKDWQSIDDGKSGKTQTPYRSLVVI